MKTFKTIKIIQIVLFLAIVTYMSMAFTYLYKTDKLLTYNPSDFSPELVDESLRGIDKNHTALDFELTNQNGETITQELYKDKIYVVDFFFTSCPTICPVMTNNMTKIQKEFLNNEDIMLLSLSVTPNIDNIPRLKTYADRYGVIDSKWNITTGDKKHIYELARKSYFATTDEGDGGLQDFIHTSNFILIDKNKQIRGVYNGIKDDEITRLVEDIKTLNGK